MKSHLKWCRKEHNIPAPGKKGAGGGTNADGEPMQELGVAEVEADG